MNDKWKQIWSKKSVDDASAIELSDLVRANGFDTGVGSYSVEQWKEMVADFCERATLREGDNVIELGCGSGAFLYAANDLVNANWYGLDYSPSLIEVAKSALPLGNFYADEANSEMFSEVEFEVVFSHSVFQYFPDLRYAKEVLSKWCSQIRSGGKLILLDINDAAWEERYHSERMQAYRSPSEYAKAYEGLDHLFFDKAWLADYLRSIDMQGIEFFPHAVKDYGNSKFRFNLICTKS